MEYQIILIPVLFLGTYTCQSLSECTIKCVCLRPGCGAVMTQWDPYKKGPAFTSQSPSRAHWTHVHMCDQSQLRVGLSP